MEKLEAVGVCFEGVAQAWLRFEERSHAFTSWEELKKQLFNKFVGLQDGSILHRFFVVRQQGSVAEYRARFEHLAASLSKLEEETMAAIFVNALNEKLRADLMVMNPIGLKEMMNMARRIEAKNQIVTSAHTPKNTKGLHSIQPKSESRTISWVPNKNTSPSLYNPNTLTTNPTHNNKDPTTHPLPKSN